MLKGLLLISVLLVARIDVSSGFLVNPGDASEILAEIGQLKEAVSTLTNQVKSSCGCASTLAPRCPDGWTMFDKSCYYFGVVPKTWQDAEVACERMSGHLAAVHSAEEEKFILDYVKRERNDLVSSTKLRRVAQTADCQLVECVTSLEC
uniref:Low affinity immunoglobulin epsilon Fc receptor n=1 Tax=Magallana gigas TaxID=29159 RepID=K1RCD1_MAGGI